MTREAQAKRNPIGEIARSLIMPLCTLGLALYAVFLSQRLSRHVLEGLALAINSVLPTGFPFMILCDIYIHLSKRAKRGGFNKLLGKIMGLPVSGIAPLFAGWICGFPQGAIGADELYRVGELDKANTERLIPLASLPSLPFIIGGVGLGMLKSRRQGIIIAVSILLSSLIAGIITKRKITETNNSIIIIGQKFSIVESIKKAGASFVTIISFITAFSVLGGALDYVLPGKWLRLVLAMLLEVTRAVKLISEASLPEWLRIGLCSSALGVGGLSALLQSRALVTEGKLSFIPYILIKLLVGALSFGISVSIFLLLNML